MKSKLKALFEILLIALIFIILTYVVQNNFDFFENLVGKNIWGIVIYVLIIIIAIVIAPISSIPLLPVVSNIWGWKIAAAVSVVGWTIGSMLAFLIARVYGVRIVKRLVSLEGIHRLENKIPKEHLFLSVVFLRIVIPVDILSYALGLFSKIKFWPYTIATFIGVIPATVILAVLGTIPFIYQLIALLIVGILVVSSWIIQITCKRCVDFVQKKFYYNKKRK